MADKFSTNELAAPALHGAVVTPNDGVDLPGGPTRAVYVGGTGHMAVDFEGGETNVLLSAIPVGTIMPLRVKRIRSTGTTATLIVALW